MTSPTSNRPDVYSRITDRIIADLEQGVRPWLKPWSAEHAHGRITRPLRHNGIPYKGINVLMLWSAAAAKGYSAPLWLTFKQARELGGNVRAGEHGEMVVYADRIQRTETDDKGGARAYYAPQADIIQMPPFETFRDPESHAATLAHELTHWTKHDSRLARGFGIQRFGEPGYAREELVAELGSAFLCADLGITPEVTGDHAAYIAGWLTVLKGDKRFIFTAASQAQRAADYLHSLQPEVAAQPEEEGAAAWQGRSCAPVVAGDAASTSRTLATTGAT
jgi:antirestriction protein ArdC